ncbi:hypothetical protein JCM10449v2_005575 [Rhodotorula kratochvilovae]
MRVKRWAPLLRPPDPPARPLRAAAPPPLRARSPPSIPELPQPSTSAAPPQEHHASNWPAVERIRDLLRSVPQPPAPAKPPPLRTRLASDLEHELVLRRRACGAIHEILAARAEPPQPQRRSRNRKGKGKAREEEQAQAQEELPPCVQREVVRLVAQTMRLQLHLGHVSSAKELDRAFFSRAPSAKNRRARRLLRRGQTPVEKSASRFTLGAGLGLSRGDHEPAWMQSLAVALAAGTHDFRALDRFSTVFQVFHKNWRAEASEVGRSHVLASLARRMGSLLRRAERATPPPDKWGRAEKVGKRMKLLMYQLRKAEEDEGAIVALALLESSLERLEGAEDLVPSDPLYQKVEADIERLVASLGDVLEALPGETPMSSTSGAGAPSHSALEKRSHILYLAIRFLLIRARHYAPPPTPASSAVTSPLASASQLYLLLVTLTPGIASNPSVARIALPRLRTRQSSILFRLLAAHLAAITAAQHRRPHMQAAEPPAAHLARLTALIASTASTLAALPAHTPPEQRRLGLSTHFMRELHLLLGSAFDTWIPPVRAVAIPSLSDVRALLDALLAARAGDALLPPVAHAGDTRAEDEKPLLRREDAARALVRAVLLSPSAPSSSSSAGGTGPDGAGDDARARLEELLRWVGAWQRASPQPQRRGGTLERKARAKVCRAVREVLERRWGGEGGREWREGVMARVEEWVEEGEREWSAQEEARCRDQDGREKPKGQHHPPAA